MIPVLNVPALYWRTGQSPNYLHSLGCVQAKWTGTDALLAFTFEVLKRCLAPRTCGASAAAHPHGNISMLMAHRFRRREYSGYICKDSHNSSSSLPDIYWAYACIISLSSTSVSFVVSGIGVDGKFLCCGGTKGMAS